MTTDTHPTPTEPPQVRFELGRGWMCECTGVWIEKIDFDLDCHHWPLCEHVVAAAKAHAYGTHSLETRSQGTLAQEPHGQEPHSLEPGAEEAAPRPILSPRGEG